MNATVGGVVVDFVEDGEDDEEEEEEAAETEQMDREELDAEESGTAEKIAPDAGVDLIVYAVAPVAQPATGAASEANSLGRSLSLNC